MWQRLKKLFARAPAAPEEKPSCFGVGAISAQDAAEKCCHDCAWRGSCNYRHWQRARDAQRTGKSDAFIPVSLIGREKQD